MRESQKKTHDHVLCFLCRFMDARIRISVKLGKAMILRHPGQSISVLDSFPFMIIGSLQWVQRNLSATGFAMFDSLSMVGMLRQISGYAEQSAGSFPFPFFGKNAAAGDQAHHGLHSSVSGFEHFRFFI